jgi:hypothetical protein
MDPIVALVSEPATILQTPACRQAKVTTAARPTTELDISIKEIFLNIIDRFGSAAWTLVRLPIRNETDNTLTTGITAGSRNILATIGALRKHKAMPPKPIPTLSQNKLDNNSWLRSLF